ncbi:hypothetical protein [Alkalihalobacillus sp. BA299]|uniref:hypothetical protein n=1 Tax=Alkalihalobacillus sp. BA299 TaxID=2815938 RepID=UPI001ADBD20E|nr:hypothetical protein [Alkalihalobacillus sp. BA299]
MELTVKAIHTTPKALTHLMIASLMGEGEIYVSDNKDIGIYVTFEPSKVEYLQNYILHNSLNRFVKIQPNTGELYIFPNKLIQKYSKQWFKGEEKIFSNQLNHKLLTYQAIIIWINLFGSRNLDSVVISTTVVKSYLRNLSYCIEKHLNTPVVPGRNSLKIHDVENLFLNTMKFSINDCTSVATFLTQKELKKLTDMSLSIDEEEGEHLL